MAKTTDQRLTLRLPKAFEGDFRRLLFNSKTSVQQWFEERVESFVVENSEVNHD